MGKLEVEIRVHGRDVVWAAILMIGAMRKVITRLTPSDTGRTLDDKCKDVLW